MAANPIQFVPQGISPLNPDGAALAKVLMAAQLAQQNAQRDIEDGEENVANPNAIIPGNALAPPQVVKTNAMGALARGLQKGLGEYEQRQALNDQVNAQMKLMQGQYQMMSQALNGEGPFAGSGGVAGSSGGAPGFDMKKYVMLKTLDPSGAMAEAYKTQAEYYKTPNSVDAQLSGLPNPRAYQAAIEHDKVGQSLVPGVNPDGSGTMIPGSAFQQPIPPIAATTPNMPTNIPRGSQPASMQGIPTPPQYQGIQTQGSVGGMPLSAQANTQLASAVNQISPQEMQARPMTALPPDQAEALKAGGENSIKMQDQIDKEAQEALNLKRGVNQMKEYLKDFTPGKAAGLRQAIAQYQVQLGSQDPDTIKLAGATEGVDKLAASMALEQMKSLNAIGGGQNGGGGGGNRIEFQSLLQNTPNKDLTPAGAQAMLDYLDKGADIPIQRQQEFSKWKVGKTPGQYQDFLPYWNQKQAANLPNTLNQIQTQQPQPYGADALKAEMQRRGLLPQGQ